ncbi:MAG: flippase [Steroidobacteraceae bacterium]
MFGRDFLARYKRGHVVAYKVARSTFWQIGEKVLRMVATLVVGVWVARYLGPARFGLLNYAIAFVALFTFLADVGLQAVVVRDLVRRPEDRPGIVASAMTVRLLGASLAIGTTSGAIWALRPHDAAARLMVLVIALGLIPQAWDIIDYDYQSRLNPRPVVLARTCSLIAFSLGRIALIVTNAQLVWFAWAVAGEAALSALLLRWRFRGALPRFGLAHATWREMRRLLSESWPVAISGLSATLYMRIDQIMLGQMLGDRAVGVYSAAVRVSESWYFLPMAMVAAAAPALTAAHRVSEATYRRKLLSVMRVLVWISILAACILHFASRRIVGLLYGAAYHQAAEVLAIHAWAGVFVSMGLASGSWFVNVGLLRLRMINTLIGAAANILLNFIVIPRYGVIGAAFATLVSYCLAGFVLNAAAAPSRPAFVLQLRSLVFR